jgi:hypothetical protein
MPVSECNSAHILSNLADACVIEQGFNLAEDTRETPTNADWYGKGWLSLY